jgi:hypothetical protein
MMSRSVLSSKIYEVIVVYIDEIVCSLYIYFSKIDPAVLFKGELVLACV